MSGPSTLCGRQPFKTFKGCLPQILLGPLLNTLSHLRVYIFLESLRIYFYFTFLSN